MGIAIGLPVRKIWFLCPHCGKRLLLYDNTAVCRGVYVKCKTCGRVVEVRL